MTIAELEQTLRDRFDDAIRDADTSFDALTLELDPDRLVEIVRKARRAGTIGKPRFRPKRFPTRILP